MEDLRNGLLRLHKVLLDSEREVYDHEVERIRSRGHLLQLVMHDPWFAWLHELSELVVLIDEILEAGEPEEALDANRLIAQARDLLTPAEAGQGFARRYFEALQRDPDVVLAHAGMLKVLAALR
jgi:hypothetical protein